MEPATKKRALEDAGAGAGAGGAVAAPVDGAGAGAGGLTATTQPVDDDELHLIVGGTPFKLHRSSLLDYPDSMLGRMFADSNRPLWEGKGPYSFPERDAAVFKSVAQLYLYDRLKPTSTAISVFDEYAFWQVEPPLPPLLQSQRFRGGAVPARDYLRQLADSLVATIKAHVLPSLVINHFSEVYAPYLWNDEFNSIHELAIFAESPGAIDTHDYAQCAKCAAGDVTHFWGSSPHPAWPHYVCVSLNSTDRWPHYANYSKVIDSMASVVKQLARERAAAQPNEPVLARVRACVRDANDAAHTASLLVSSEPFVFMLHAALARENIELREIKTQAFTDSALRNLEPRTFVLRLPRDRNAPSYLGYTRLEKVPTAAREVNAGGEVEGCSDDDKPGPAPKHLAIVMALAAAGASAVFNMG